MPGIYIDIRDIFSYLQEFPFNEGTGHCQCKKNIIFVLGHRLRALTITVGPTLQKARSTCAYFNGPARNGQHLVIKCSKKTAKGRVVKLTQRTYKGYMHLAEVKVFAYKKNCVPKEETFML